MSNDERVICPACDDGTMIFIEEDEEGEVWQCQNKHCQEKGYY